MLKRTTTLIALVAAAFSTGSSGAATTTDICVGSKPGCFATIQAAVDAAQDGDTIRIGAGTFTGGSRSTRACSSRASPRAPRSSRVAAR